MDRVSSRQEPIYVAAREVLLDALQALSPQIDAVVVVGAQAVYLRTGDAGIAVAPYTTDADLVLDLNQLREVPTLVELLTNADFNLSEKHEPGVWLTERDVEDRVERMPIDVMVPTMMAPVGGRRGVRLGVHGNTAARKTPGLEAALYDNEAMEISSLDPARPRSLSARVAGPLALLVAKAHKIQERLDQQARPDRILDKDAGDVFRLMQTGSPGDCAETVIRLRDVEPAATSIASGLERLFEQVRAAASSGTSMAIRDMRGQVPPARIQAVCTGFVRTLTELL